MYVQLRYITIIIVLQRTREMMMAVWKTQKCHEQKGGKKGIIKQLQQHSSKQDDII